MTADWWLSDWYVHTLSIIPGVLFHGGRYNRLHGNWGEKTLHKDGLEVLVPSRSL